MTGATVDLGEEEEHGGSEINKTKSQEEEKEDELDAFLDWNPWATRIVEKEFFTKNPNTTVRPDEGKIDKVFILQIIHLLRWPLVLLAIVVLALLPVFFCMRISVCGHDCVDSSSCCRRPAETMAPTKQASTKASSQQTLAVPEQGMEVTMV